MSEAWREDVADEIVGKRPSRRGYVKAHCPACPERIGRIDRSGKVSVNIYSGRLRCWRCGWRSRLPGEWPDDVDGEHEEEGWEEVAWEEPSDFHPLTDPARVLEPAREYLRGRGLGPEVWEEAGLGYALTGREAGRIIYPAFGIDGLQIGWAARPLRGKLPPGAPRYRTAPGMDRVRRLYNEPALLGDVVILVEGPHDALAHWPRAAGFLGKPSPSQLETVAVCVEPDAHVIVALDGDTVDPVGGRSECAAMARMLRNLRRGTGTTTALLLPPEADPDTAAWEVLDAINLALATGAELIELRA